MAEVGFAAAAKYSDIAQVDVRGIMAADVIDRVGQNVQLVCAAVMGQAGKHLAARRKVFVQQGHIVCQHSTQHAGQVGIARFCDKRIGVQGLQTPH